MTDQLRELRRDARASLSTNHRLLAGLDELRRAQRGEDVGKLIQPKRKRIPGAPKPRKLTDDERQEIVASPDTAAVLALRYGVGTQSILRTWRKAGRVRQPGERGRPPRR